MNFKVDIMDKIDPPLSTQCRVVALPTRQYNATRRFAGALQLLELHVNIGTVPTFKMQNVRTVST